jgi:hypothetical protein
MKVIHLLALSGALTAAVCSTADAEVRLSIGNGRVSLSAKDATVRQILAEWARVGNVRMVNIERVPGAPLTLELKDVPEEQALDLLLRAVSGYMAAPRRSVVPNASRFDRIVVMATASVPRAPVAATPSIVQQPVFNQMPQPLPDDAPEEPERQPIAAPSANPRGPVFNPFAQPQVVNPPIVGSPVITPGTVDASEPQDGTASPQTPSVFPGTVSVPGMIAAPPQPQPGQGNDRR